MGRAMFDALSRFPKWIAKGNWDGLESTFHNQAREWSGRSLARQIGDVDLKHYRASLSRGLVEAEKAAEDHQAKAVYFEYDMNSGWGSRFLICKSYEPESARNDEWTSEWTAEVEGPRVPEFGRIYRTYGFDRTDQAKGATLYMVARTVAAMGRCVQPGTAGAAALCIAYHDQKPILRMHEGAGA